MARNRKILARFFSTLSYPLLAVIVFSFFFPSSSSAVSGTEGAAFLDIPVGAGPAALGSAYTALATDAYAPVWNPAGLGFVTAPEVAGQHLSYLESINYEFGSIAIPLPHGAGLGTSVQYLGSGNITGTNPDGSAAPDFSSYFAAYTLSYGQKILDKLSVGLSGKFIDGKIADTSAHAYAADLGALYEATTKFHLAATVTNMGSKLTFTDQGDSLPLAFHLAAAYQPENHWKLILEGVESQGESPSARVGTEWHPIDAVTLRVGYKTDTTQQLSAIAGFTTGVGITFWGQEFAYAWLPYGDLGDTQYFSLLLRFGQDKEEKRNLIQYQSIRKSKTAEAIHPTDPDYQQMMQLLDESKEPVASTQAPEQQP
jgi:hypothetical protein